jgi:hypothetical protein
MCGMIIFISGNNLDWLRLQVQFLNTEASAHLRNKIHKQD